MARYFMLDDDVQEAIGDIVCEFTTACECFHKSVDTGDTLSVFFQYSMMQAAYDRLDSLGNSNRYPGIEDSPIYQAVVSDLTERMFGSIKDLKVAR